jgi:hypothetical protein
MISRFDCSKIKSSVDRKNKNSVDHEDSIDRDDSIDCKDFVDCQDSIYREDSIDHEDFVDRDFFSIFLKCRLLLYVKVIRLSWLFCMKVCANGYLMIVT